MDDAPELTPAAVIERREKEFGAISQAADLTGHIVKLPVLTGGAAEHPDDAPGILCLRKSTALEIWLADATAEMRRHLSMTKHGAKRPEAWALESGLHLDRWHITVEDSLHMQRVAQDRYSVSATILIVEKT